MAYEVLILGVNRAGLLKKGSLSVVPKSDNRNDCSFILKTTAATYLPKVGQDLKVKKDGNVIFGGCIKTINKKKIQVGIGSDKLLEVTVTSDGYSHIPARRTPQWSFNNVTCGYVVNKIVTDLLSQEGVTAGTINAGITLVEFDTNMRSCKDILDELAKSSGYKWYIDDSKALHFLQEDPVIDAAHDLIEGGAFKDFTIEDIEETLDNYRNKQFVLGGIGDDGYAVTAEVSLDTEIIARKADEGGVAYSTGVYGDVINDSNLTLSEDATTAATNALKQYGVIPQRITFISKKTFDWKAGTKLKAKLPTYGINTDSYYLIESAELVDIDGINKIMRVTATARKGDSFSTQRSQSSTDFFSNLVAAAKDNGGSTKLASDDEGNLYPVTPGVVQVFVEPEMPTYAKKKDILVEIDNPTVDDGLTTSATTLTWASPRQINATGNVTLPDPASAKNMLGESTDHTGIVMFCIRNANTTNGMVTVSGGGFTKHLFPQQAITVRCGITTSWEVV